MKHLGKVRSAVSKLTGRTGLTIKAASPEILLTIGIIGTVGAAVLACRATLKVHEVLEEHDEKLEKITEACEKVESGEIAPEVYTQKDKSKDLLMTYMQTGVGFIKLYGPAITLGIASFACIIGGHKIMKTRNVALMAAYQALEKGFAAYRKRVVEEFGEEKDYMYKNGLRSETVVETEIDENGKAKKVKKVKMTVDDPNGLSIYARFFDDSSTEWQKDNDYNLMFLRQQQNYWNDLLKVRGHVFLNEIYDALGLPRSQAGAVVGWVISEDGDNFIDFGIWDGDKPRSRDFVNGYENSILLDFNVDGVIYNLFTKKKGLIS